MSEKNIVDSSGWLEYFGDTPRASLYSEAIENTVRLVVPVICIYEVFKKVFRERGEGVALEIASVMQTGSVIDLDLSLALESARYQLPLADSIIYASAVRHNATLWTQDDHFEGLGNVRYFPM